jgi:hypothetical protein
MNVVKGQRWLYKITNSIGLTWIFVVEVCSEAGDGKIVQIITQPASSRYTIGTNYHIIDMPDTTWTLLVGQEK